MSDIADRQEMSEAQGRKALDQVVGRWPGRGRIEVLLIEADGNSPQGG
jgi:hypothetical protein